MTNSKVSTENNVFADPDIMPNRYFFWFAWTPYRWISPLIIYSNVIPICKKRCRRPFIRVSPAHKSYTGSNGAISSNSRLWQERRSKIAERTQRTNRVTTHWKSSVFLYFYIVMKDNQIRILMAIRPIFHLK